MVFLLFHRYIPGQQTRESLKKLLVHDGDWLVADSSDPRMLCASLTPQPLAPSSFVSQTVVNWMAYCYVPVRVVTPVPPHHHPVPSHHLPPLH